MYLYIYIYIYICVYIYMYWHICILYIYIYVSRSRHVSLAKYIMNSLYIYTTNGLGGLLQSSRVCERSCLGAALILVPWAVLSLGAHGRRRANFIVAWIDRHMHAHARTHTRTHTHTYMYIVIDINIEIHI